MYVFENLGIYEKCMELGKVDEASTMLPFGDLFLDWNFESEKDDVGCIVAAGKNIIVRGSDASVIWSEQLSGFKKEFSMIKSSFVAGLDDVTTLNDYFREERERFRKKIVIDVAACGDKFVDKIEKLVMFFRKVQHLVNWCNNIDKGYTFLVLNSGFSSLPEGSLCFNIIRNTNTNRGDGDNDDFFSTLDDTYENKDYDIAIVGGLVKNGNDGSWGIDT